MSRTFDALKRADAARRATAGEPQQPRVARVERLSALRGWRARRHARDATRATRRAEAAARHVALVGRLDSLEQRLARLDETVTKQLAELEPRLLHVLELRSQGLERELASLARRAEPEDTDESHPPVRALSLALLAWFALLAFGVGFLFAQSCSG